MWPRAQKLRRSSCRNRSALPCEGKRWSVFIANLPDDLIHSGCFDLANAYREDSEYLRWVHHLVHMLLRQQK